MSPSRLAFVVATKDRPEELRRLWKSLLAQTRLPDEVVVVEKADELDAGTDGVNADVALPGRRRDRR
jgi:hypothetical protein